MPFKSDKFRLFGSEKVSWLAWCKEIRYEFMFLHPNRHYLTNDLEKYRMITSVT